jgi:DNA-binding NarL/FixJ family response regulator
LCNPQNFPSEFHAVSNDSIGLQIVMPGFSISTTVCSNDTAVAMEIKRRGLPARVLALSSYSNARYVRAMIDAGAAGYLLKDEAPERIVEAVRAAARGKSLWTTEQVLRAQRWQEEVKDRWAQLTTREREVLMLVAVGQSNKQIARELKVREKTVEYHVTNTLSKLGVGSRAEAIVWMKDSGLEIDA